MNALHQTLYGNYRNKKFTDIWSNVDDFLEDYNTAGIPVSISNDTATTLFYLLYARYGNSTIASSDETRFKYSVFSTIFMYGPTWEKRLVIQKGVRDLIGADGKLSKEILDGGKAIYNTALNPSQPVSSGQGSSSGEGTNTLEELTYINQQNTTNYKKTKVDAYSILIQLLETDVTEEFIGKFKKLFLTVVSPELPLWYIEGNEYVEDNTHIDNEPTAIFTSSAIWFRDDIILSKATDIIDSTTRLPVTDKRSPSGALTASLVNFFDTNMKNKILYSTSDSPLSKDKRYIMVSMQYGITGFADTTIVLLEEIK